MKKPLKFLTSLKKHVTDSNEKRNMGGLLKKALTRNIVPKLLCVCAALCLWFYVVDAESSESVKEFKGVEITFSRNENGLKVLSSSNVTVDVVLSGKRSVLNRMSAEDISATVDIAHISEATDEKFNIKVSTLNETSVESFEPFSVRLYLDEPSSRTVSVKADYTGGTSDDKTLKIGDLVPSKSSISVSGPLEAISKVAYAKATVNLEGFISHSVNIANVELDLYDSEGTLIRDIYPVEYEYIEIGNIASDRKVDVYVPVYMIKELPVVPQYRYGLFSPGTVEYKVEPAAVTVRGDVDLMETLTEIKTTPIDDSKIGNSCTVQAVYDLPDGVSLSGSSSTCRMTLSVKNYSEKTLYYPGSEINIINLPDDLQGTVLSESVRVTICGTADSLKKVDWQDLKLDIDASALSEGKYYGQKIDAGIVSVSLNEVYIKENDYKADIEVRKLSGVLPES